MPRIYEYTDPHITCSPIVAQDSRLFSENKCNVQFRLKNVDKNTIFALFELLIRLLSL